MFIKKESVILEDVDTSEGNKIDFTAGLPKAVNLCDKEIHFIK